MSFQSTIIQHDVIIGAANEAIASVPNGTTGQVLTANTGADPSWVTLPGGLTENFIQVYLNAYLWLMRQEMELLQMLYLIQ